jgi:hypothetical protein
LFSVFLDEAGTSAYVLRKGPARKVRLMQAKCKYIAAVLTLQMEKSTLFVGEELCILEPIGVLPLQERLIAERQPPPGKTRSHV